LGISINGKFSEATGETLYAIVTPDAIQTALALWLVVGSLMLGKNA
jgi:hypothetical protein